MNLVLREKGRGQTLPDGAHIEGKHEFDRRASEERGKKGVNGTMNMMKRKDVEEVILGGVVPGFQQ